LANRGETDGASPLLGKRVVICEDEALTFLQMARAFEKAGLEVCGSAADGVEAVKVIRRCRPDIVTMDLNLPAMNGIESIRRLQGGDPVCVIVVTAYSDEETRRRALEAGACGFLTKPVSSNSLLPAVERIYAEHQGRTAPAA